MEFGSSRKSKNAGWAKRPSHRAQGPIAERSAGLKGKPGVKDHLVFSCNAVEAAIAALRSRRSQAARAPTAPRDQASPGAEPGSSDGPSTAGRAPPSRHDPGRRPEGQVQAVGAEAYGHPLGQLYMASGGIASATAISPGGQRCEGPSQ